MQRKGDQSTKQNFRQKEQAEDWGGEGSIIVYSKDKSVSADNVKLADTGADPGFYLGGGALVSCSTSTPINHTVFFLQNTCCIRKPQVISGEGAHPSHPPLDPPLRQRGYLRTRILADNAQVPYLVKDHSGNGVLTRAKTIPYLRLETLNPPGIQTGKQKKQPETKRQEPSIQRGQTANCCCSKVFPAGHPTSF